MDFTISRISVLFLFLLLSVSAFSQEEATAESAEDQPASAVSLYNDGLTKLKDKDYTAALPLMVEAIAAADTTSETDQKVIGLAQRNGAIAAYYVGTDQRKEEKIADAIETFKMGIEYNPTFYANFIGLAQALDDNGDKVEAVTAYLKAAEVCAQSDKTADKVESMETKAMNTVIRLYVDKDMDQTLAAADAFLAMKESADIYAYKARALQGKGQSQEALAAAEKALATLGEGDNADMLYFAKGEIHEALGQKDDAIAAYQKAGGKYADSAKYKISELQK
jgi:tetratricopeptide (TPR) repeat protein